MYPILEINLDKLKQNICTVKKMCNNISLAAVLKGVESDEKILSLFISENINIIGESSIENIKNIRRIYRDKVKIIFLRTPAENEIYDCARLCDYILVSHETKISKIREINRKIKIIMMADIGDGREGITFDDNNNIKITEETDGVGTIKGCISNIKPDTNDLEIITKIRDKYFNGKILSLGGTYFADVLPEIVKIQNIQLRIGELFFTGINPLSNGRTIEGMNNDVMRIKCEILEINIRGEKKEAVVLCGESFLNPKGLETLDKKIKIKGYTSEHMIVDIAESDNNYSEGGVIIFIPNYTNFSTYYKNKYKKTVYLSTF